LGRMAGRALAQTTRGERAHASFVQWQAERAAARRATSAGDTAASAGGTVTSAGDTMMVVAGEAEPCEASELRRAAPTPSTDYTLQQPPEIAFVPEEAGRALRQQVAGILAGDDERRQLWIGLAHEVLLQSEGLQPSPPPLMASMPFRRLRLTHQHAPHSPHRDGWVLSLTTALCSHRTRSHDQRVACVATRMWATARLASALR
jgi:hypothetical protein